ncbi:MAG: helix-turn-helix domain-containing protein [Chloroflexota bacterium]
MSGQVELIPWAETADELEAGFRQAPTVGTRKRFQVLWLVRSGSSVRGASRLAGVGERTGSRWLAWYRDGGLASVLSREPGRTSRGRPPRLTPAQRAEVARAVSEREITGYHAAREWLKWRFGVDYSYHGIYALLHRLGVHPEAANPDVASAPRGCTDDESIPGTDPR